MNTYNVNDENFKNSTIYQDFIKENPMTGSLRIRAYAASQAIPIQGLKVMITTDIDNDKIIFFEGFTDSSGVIDGIKLPAPKLEPDNLDVPNKTTYEIMATYVPDNVTKIYYVNMYEDICVVQNINIVPETLLKSGGF